MPKSFGHYISAIYRHIQIHLNQEFSIFGFGSGQYLYFNHISHNEGITQKELSRILAIDKATTTKAVHKLIEQGYICTKQNSEDSRSYRLYLTQSGRNILPEVRRILTRTTEILKQEMSSLEAENSLSSLRKMFHNITSHNEQARNKK